MKTEKELNEALEGKFIVMYVKDGGAYPVALTQEQFDIVQFSLRIALPTVKIVDEKQFDISNKVCKKKG